MSFSDYFKNLFPSAMVQTMYMILVTTIIASVLKTKKAFN